MQIESDIKTQIEIFVSTRTRLRELKIIEREPYDNVINRYIDKVNDLNEKIKQLELKITKLEGE